MERRPAESARRASAGDDAAGTPLARGPEQPGPGRPGPLDPAAIRADFPILETIVRGKPLIYLDNAATTQKPRDVIDSIVSFYEQTNSNVHRGVHHLSELASEAFESARETVRRFLNAGSASEIVFTHGTTESINIVADSFGRGLVGEGDEIVVTEMEHHSNLVPWQQLCERVGATLKILPFADDGRLQLDALPALLGERTKLLAVSYVSNVLGIVNPVRECVEAAHARDIPVLVDAAQAAAHLPIDVERLDCDFLAFSGHKMYAETGIGVLYGKQRWLESMPPSRYGGGMVGSVELERSSLGELPHRFEAGTPHIAGAIGLAAAIDYLDRIGLPQIEEHERRVMNGALERLKAIDGLTLYGTAGEKCGALTFNIDGMGAYDVAMLLDSLGVGVRSGTHCAEPVMKHYGITSAVRASLALYNTTEDVDALVEALERVRATL